MESEPAPLRQRFHELGIEAVVPNYPHRKWSNHNCVITNDTINAEWKACHRPKQEMNGDDPSKGIIDVSFTLLHSKEGEESGVDSKKDVNISTLV